MYEDGYGSEFVFRQPRTPPEVHALVCAAECDPFGGYGGDGDAHWMNDAAAGARVYVAHIDRGLEDYLRGYVFRLAEGRPARGGEGLPRL
ncbi:hypothetical protein [Streptomyces sp. NPDC056492]|uniref:hypothetical protein n=1 Tax=unclassified Streptomyces TaxID=2593676 RepID=UPI0036B662DF